MTAENPEGVRGTFSESEVRAALSEVDIQAGDHGGDYAAGMREGRRIVETRLLGATDEDSDSEADPE